MESVTRKSIIEFLERLGEVFPPSGSLYLLGGSALFLLGNQRKTLDIDYTTDLDPEVQKELETVIQKLAYQIKLDVEPVHIAEFVPLPPDAASRRQFVGRFVNMDVYIFDLYSIALSKISRGFESDIDDVLFLLGQRLISFDLLVEYFQVVLPDSSKFDIDPEEFTRYLGEVRRRWLA